MWNLAVRKTLVLWVIEEEQIPTSDEFWSINHKSEQALANEGYYGKMEFEVYVVHPDKELSQEYWDAYVDAGIITIYRDPEGEFFYLKPSFLVIYVYNLHLRSLV